LVLTYTTDWDTLGQMGGPAGWTEVAGLAADGGANGLHARTWYRFATASEPAGYTVTGTAGQSKSVVVTAFRGAHPSSPFEAVGVATPARDATVECPSLTTTVAVVLSCSYGGGYNPTPNPGQGFTAPAGMTERADATDTYLLAGSATQTVTATGATGQRVATASAPFTGGTTSVATAYALRA
jgi:hypothetical protein